MYSSGEPVDAQLAASLKHLSAQRPGYWSFDGNATRRYCHNYFQYPAMMVPEMLGDLMKVVVDTDPNVRTVFDAFAGAGTVLTETMLLGRNFIGQDINPMAVLLCRAKSGPFRDEVLAEVILHLKQQLRADRSNRVDIEFPNRRKWFEDSVSIGLSRIRRAIRRIRDLWCRRFLWVALAETVRLCSNSRTSTFKLHIRPAIEIANRDLCPIDIFEQVTERNLSSLIEFRNALEQRGLLSRGCYSYDTVAKLKNAMCTAGRPPQVCDLLVTSPPYGDNTSTVPYGQHSHLPLQWIDLSDIDEGLDEGCLRTTQEIDRRSLGGSGKNALADAEAAIDTAPSFKRFLDSIRSEPTDRSTRAAAFIRDLDVCIDPILQQLRRDAYMIWVIGNRRIGGRLLPTDAILSELLTARNAKLIVRIDRDIPTKRMALKNNVTSTMRKERILVFRKATFQPTDASGPA